MLLVWRAGGEDMMRVPMWVYGTLLVESEMLNRSARLARQAIGWFVAVSVVAATFAFVAAQYVGGGQ